MVVVDFAMAPKKVLSPVAKTTQTAVPLVKLQPERATFLASYSSVAFGSAPSLMSTFSPVSEALFTFRSDACNTRRSAGTFSPPVTLMMSPGTNSSAGFCISSPSR